jgi:hypothetical protein
MILRLSTLTLSPEDVPRDLPPHHDCAATIPYLAYLCISLLAAYFAPATAASGQFLSIPLALTASVLLPAFIVSFGASSGPSTLRSMLSTLRSSLQQDQEKEREKERRQQG